ncbi:outer membrane lipoprotein-sorting protein [Hydrogenimonas thermophila]|uniref:outer membrane lipoprotein-sorting protein n=1 Tax=Hydrogenimonas thermophila TaxID=223786 RepID=UPI002936D6D3|nr:outer membrane lipoprotein-sorting protein [Hydrogenimonas thermophila]WOE70243.1 outer membrane lipoprotein-sorting protein [Hydrogenimonas thermophila]WOE72760.1 outer membrane lipoprotein-sorting protein [Hydrogenimonas thermophila]
MLKKCLFTILFGITLFAQSGLEVAKKSYDMLSGYKSSVSEVTMVLKNSSGDENIRKLQIDKLEGSDGDKSLITFLFPLDLKGTKLLSYEIIGKDDKQWLYLPSLNRVKRISSRNRSGSFMGSEFSYEDISSQNYKNYTYEADVKDVEIGGKRYLKVVRIPKDKTSGYSKQIIFIDPKSYLAKFGEYYDKRGRLLKKVSFLEYVKIDGVYRIKKIYMQNLQNRKSTILIWDKDRINAGLKTRDFSKRALK